MVANQFGPHSTRSQKSVSSLLSSPIMNPFNSSPNMSLTTFELVEMRLYPETILIELDQMMMRMFELKVYPNLSHPILIIPSHPSIIELDQMMMRMFESGQSAIAGSQVLQQAGHCVLCKHRQ